MKIAFRVDASHDIGIGHVMRCLTLADKLSNQDVEIRFVSRYMPQSLIDKINSKGYELKLSSTEYTNNLSDDVPHSKWLGTSQLSDANDTMSLLSDKSWHWVVVDHYSLDSRWESVIRRMTKKILVIDDIADRDHDCDILLDQNLYADMYSRYIGKVSDDAILLLGPEYSLLRDEFSRIHETFEPKTGIIRRILVSMGGVDAKNITEKVINAISMTLDKSCVVDVVIGSQHPKRDEIMKLCQRYGFQCHIDVKDMAALMADADIAFGSSGSTSWERCCLGLPTICLTHADNQVGIAEGLEMYGVIVNLGDGTSISVEQLSNELSNILEKPKLLESMSIKALELVDGKGAFRVCNKMQSAL